METVKISESIDNILSYEGGLPKGRMIELYGRDGSGKTTLACIIAGKYQQQGHKVFWVDEEGLNIDHANFLGFDISEDDESTYGEFDTGEEALNDIIRKCEAGYGLVVVDSVPNLLPESVVETENIEDNKQYGPVATLLAKALPKIRKAAKKSGTTVILINQIRAKIAARGFAFGPSTDSAAGYALKHAVAMRLEVARVSWIKKGVDIIGFNLKIRAPHKNRYAPPNKEATVEIIFDHDIDLEKLNDRRKNKLELIQ